MTKVRFFIEVETQRLETVCIIGDHDALGNWNPERILSLDLKMKNVWCIDIDLPANQEINYRYCITRDLESAERDEKKAIIKQWETNINPRKSFITDENDLQILPVAQFGNYDGYHNTTSGWLSKQTYVQLRLQGNPIHMHKAQHQHQTLHVKCVPQDYRPKNVDINEDSDEGPQSCSINDVLISVLREDGCKPHEQKPFGEAYQPNDFIVFTTNTLHPETLGFQLEFYIQDTSNGHIEPQYIGYTHILPLNTQHTLEEKHLPLMSLKHKPFGKISIHFMIAKPVKNIQFNMESCFQSHWKSLGVSLDVGHRGMGSSYKKLALVRENTVASLSAAAQNGADLVEFDVMLTKDLHTVVYHDFEVCLTYGKKRNEDSGSKLLIIPVKDLTLEQLQSMKLFHASSRLGEQIDINGEDFHPADAQPFPTLQQCFHGVDESLGFNIEIKFPLQDETGVWEMEGFMDHNTYIDILLQAVFKDCGSRRIIFSSFDPECCILLQRKQNKYPVLFLSNGPTKRYTPYLDARTRGYDVAMYFALCEGLLGVDLQSECLLSDLEVIKRVRDKGLVLFVWGEDNNDRETISTLRKHGVHGIIYDRIDFYKTDKNKYFEAVEANELPKMETGESSKS
ncbi:hypothetical protein SNE40_000920 [Patella caerulea]|uniref:Glycerophosphocholine phosphodiesterase GPCPD1 n=1 Tax=Patella caerulea TaxID=87958 RepID=A0AAN8QAL0_PATCE